MWEIVNLLYLNCAVCTKKVQLQDSSFHIYPLAQELNPLDSTIRDNIWRETPGDATFPLGFADGAGGGFLISIFSAKPLSFICDNGRVVLNN